MKHCRLIPSLGLLLVTSLVSCKKDDVKPQETVLYETNFDSDDGKWALENPFGDGTATIGGGYYTINGKTTGMGVYTSSIFYNNAKPRTAIETSIKLTSTGPSTAGTGGLLWGQDTKETASPTDDIVFYFLISYDGQYTISGFPNDSNHPLVNYKDWQNSSAVRNSQFNKLRIALIDNVLHFYINETEVHSMPSPIANGTLDQAGVSALKYSIAQFDYFKATELP